MDGPTATKQIRDLGYKGLILGVTGEFIVLVTCLLAFSLLAWLLSRAAVDCLVSRRLPSNPTPSSFSLPLFPTPHLHPPTYPSPGNAVSADIAAFKASGADEVLIKPVNADSLEAAFVKYGIMEQPATA
jgi:hypothetical protein